MTVRVGTCSWTDKSLIQSGKFYPDGVTSAEGRLRYYASIFPTVEVDSTYYGLPSRRNSELWVDRTPDAFTFHVKAFRLFTGHWADLRALPPGLREEAAQHVNPNNRVYARDLPDDVIDPLWDYFYGALQPLADSGRLGNVLFQFAPWVHPGRGTLRLISEAKERMSPYQIAVEFRNNRWLSVVS